VQLTISGRHVDVTDALRSHVEERIEHLQKYFDRITRVDVILSVEKFRHRAEVTLHGNHMVAHADEVTDDMYASIDRAAHVIEKRVRRYKERLKRHHDRKTEAGFVSAPLPEDEGAASEGGEERRIIPTEPLVAKPMSPEEAVLQMELLGRTFLAFTNDSTEEINVVFERDDGNYGLIQP